MTAEAGWQILADLPARAAATSCTCRTMILCRLSWQRSRLTNYDDGTGRVMNALLAH